MQANRDDQRKSVTLGLKRPTSPIKTEKVRENDASRRDTNAIRSQISMSIEYQNKITSADFGKIRSCEKDWFIAQHGWPRI